MKSQPMESLITADGRKQRLSLPTLATGIAEIDEYNWALPRRALLSPGAGQ